MGEDHIKTILALDQSTNITGYALFNDKDLIESGRLDNSKNKNPICRMIELINWLESFMSDKSIDIVYIEDTQLQDDDMEKYNNPLTFQTLSKLIGIIEYKLTLLNQKYKIIRPSEWRSELGINTGKKRLQLKKNATDFVKKTFNLEPSEDECEAICIGYAAYLRETKSINTGWGDPKFF